MPSPGQLLGTYEITSLAGKGGMGEVYRARDTRLKRDVAIKLLPAEFSRDPERVSRLQREAEVIASLNHPNIAGIHDLQEAEGSSFLVLEFVEGDTLADRLSAGPIPLRESLEMAKQLCEAHSSAHEKGIIHRDLKPANIFSDPNSSKQRRETELRCDERWRFLINKVKEAGSTPLGIVLNWPSLLEK